MATIDGWRFVRGNFYVDASHQTYDIALVNEGEFVDLRYRERDPMTPTRCIVRFFPRTKGFEKGTEDSQLIDIGKDWLMRVNQSNGWRSICVNIGIEPYDLGSLIESLTTCVRGFIGHVDTGRTRRRIEDRLRKDPELVKAIALIMGIE